MTAITHYDPDIYDLMHPGTVAGDIQWYCQKAALSGGPVLELGAGTGRVTVPIAHTGVRVTALDRDTGMLARLRDKLDTLPDDVRTRVSIQQGDMRSFALGETFALVIIPFRAFLHNVTLDDRLTTLKHAHDHLRSGGELAFNVFHPSLEYMSAHAGSRAGTWRWSGTNELPDGRFVLYSDATRYDTVHQRVHSLIRTEEFNTAGHLVDTQIMRLELAYLYPADIRQLLDRSGFDLIRISGDFTGRPFERDGDELVIEARKR